MGIGLSAIKELAFIGVRQRIAAGPRGPARPDEVYVQLGTKGNSYRRFDESIPLTAWLGAMFGDDSIFLMSDAPQADRLAYEIAHLALPKGAKMLRILRGELALHQHEAPNDDTSKVLVTVYRFLPRLFVPVTSEDVARYRAKHQLDQLALAI